MRHFVSVFVCACVNRSRWETIIGELVCIKCVHACVCIFPHFVLLIELKVVFFSHKMEFQNNGYENFVTEFPKIS